MKTAGFSCAETWSALTEEDLSVLRQNTYSRKFDFTYTLCVAKRCKFGVPQVVVCRPYGKDCRPFPTLFWLVCPYLDRVCGKLESEQNITLLESLFRKNSDAILAFHKKYQDIRLALIDDNVREKIITTNLAMWKSLKETGIGGISWKKFPYSAKCLHLQTATLLGMNEHPAQDLISELIGDFNCPDNY
ncbi:MAG: DUF501 domain-containing protein [Synergistaceae bacterium]